MKRRTTHMVLGFLVTVLAAQTAHAQMINYERRNKYLKARAIPQSQTTTAASQATKYSSYSPTKKAEEMTPPKVTNRLEQLYDANGDGRLEKSEIQELYRYALNVVEQHGKVRVASDLLKSFDTNEDGVISKWEARSLKRALQ